MIKVLYIVAFILVCCGAAILIPSIGGTAAYDYISDGAGTLLILVGVYTGYQGRKLNAS